MSASDLNKMSPDQLRQKIRSFDWPEIFRIFSTMVTPHIQAQELFEELPYDSSSALHDLTQVSYPPKPSSLRDVRALAGLATPNREPLITRVFSDRPDQLNELYNHARDDRPVAIFMAHDDITDIGRVLPEVLVALCEYHADLAVGEATRGSDTWEQAAERMYQVLCHKFHIILAGTLRLVGALGFPVADLLANIGWVHFSFPITESTRESELPVELMRVSNRLMRMELEEMLRNHGGIVGLAGPGSVDKRQPLHQLTSWLQHIPDRYRDRYRVTRHVQPIHAGTADLIKDMYVLPVAAKVTGASPFVQTGRLQRVRHLDDLHQIMEWIADTCTRCSFEITVYHRDPQRWRSALLRWRRDGRE
ncbi:hypothetical protein IT415_02370 [bacterium]|nr:hypothetical protein [bacterium]